jgi:chemotaxis protein MotB
MSRRRIHFFRKETEPQNGGGWEIIYTGFVLILLCFFIMLSSFATMQESKIAQFVRSFIDAVSIFSGGVGFEDGKEVVAPSKAIVDLRNDLAEIFKELQLFTASHALEEELELVTDDDRLTMRLTDRAVFAEGDARISKEARLILDGIGAILARSERPIRIEGHTDNRPIHTDSYPSNWELSTARAVNVLRYLMARFDIPSGRLAAAGFAEFRPLRPNDSEAGRAKNRRVEITLLSTARPPERKGR